MSKISKLPKADDPQLIRANLVEQMRQSKQRHPAHKPAKPQITRVVRSLIWVKK